MARGLYDPGVSREPATSTTSGVTSTPLIELFRVAEIRGAETGEPAPPEIAERFEGRVFTLAQLEARAIRITGRTGWYLATGRDWRLSLEQITR